MHYPILFSQWLILILHIRKLRHEWVLTNLSIWLYRVSWLILIASFSTWNLNPRWPSSNFRQCHIQCFNLHPKPQQYKSLWAGGVFVPIRKRKEANGWDFHCCFLLPFSCAPCCTNYLKYPPSPVVPSIAYANQDRCLKHFVWGTNIVIRILGRVCRITREISWNLQKDACIYYGKTTVNYFHNF